MHPAPWSAVGAFTSERLYGRSKRGVKPATVDAAASLFEICMRDLEYRASSVSEALQMSSTAAAMHLGNLPHHIPLDEAMVLALCGELGTHWIDQNGL